VPVSALFPPIDPQDPDLHGNRRKSIPGSAVR